MRTLMMALMLASGFLSAIAEAKGRNVLLTCAVPKSWTVPAKDADETYFDNNLGDQYELTDEAKRASRSVSGIKFGEFVTGDKMLLIQEPNGDQSLEFQDSTDTVVSRGYEPLHGRISHESSSFLMLGDSYYPDVFSFKIESKKVIWVARRDEIIELSATREERFLWWRSGGEMAKNAVGNHYSTIFEAGCY